LEVPDTTSETTNVAELGDSDGGKRRIEMEGVRDVKNKWCIMLWIPGAGERGSGSVRVGEKTVGASYLCDNKYQETEN